MSRIPSVRRLQDARPNPSGAKRQEDVMPARPRVIASTALLTATLVAGCADDATPTATALPGQQATLTSNASLTTDALTPILAEPLTGRHQFTDEVATQIRLKPHGRSRTVVNLADASHYAVVKFTIQPGVRFPWHTHPGPVMVAITQGELVYVYGDDCVERTYPAGTALADPGTNVHYAFNPTGGETVLIATFLGASASDPLTNPVPEADAAALDHRCGIAP
jgi:quercetin dioxygenase-like cupin family protein